MSQKLLKLRSFLLKTLASILTTAITLLYLIFRVFSLLPLPSFSHLHRDFLYSLNCCCARVNLNHNLYLIINSTLSLLSALIIANYCETMLAIVEWTSHQTHAVFLNFVFPKFPQLSTYTPSWIVEVYLMLGYVGLTSQLALTLDLIYIYNLPAIYMYKILAFSYSKIIIVIQFCLQVIQYNHKRWLTCPYPFLSYASPSVNKFVATGAVIILGQVLVIVAFYYMWLTLVILMLVLAMNFVRNLIEVIRKISDVLLLVKGYRLEILYNDMESSLNENSNIKIQTFTDKIRQVREIEVNWIPLIKLQDIRDVFIGKDIVRIVPRSFSFGNRLNFSITRIYQSFLYLDHNK